MKNFRNVVTLVFFNVIYCAFAQIEDYTPRNIVFNTKDNLEFSTSQSYLLDSANKYRTNNYCALEIGWGRISGYSVARVMTPDNRLYSGASVELGASFKLFPSSIIHTVVYGDMRFIHAQQTHFPRLGINISTPVETGYYIFNGTVGHYLNTKDNDLVSGLQVCGSLTYRKKMTNIKQPFESYSFTLGADAIPRSQILISSSKIYGQFMISSDNYNEFSLHAGIRQDMSDKNKYFPYFGIGLKIPFLLDKIYVGPKAKFRDEKGIQKRYTSI